ncbi:MAG: chemotaxis protein CheW [Melioribacteraceae bacterium]|nr:chemotaxis protein CheW [Melioribacteraceae bacterium]MCF8355174.1 chemotaxis protein CheW [Melioribacteraceae bacterium]MCF8392503.1 chemotaxis protein CheW [Melioribacteraceae bacterium]MCF8418414.1 chemotaxis protein CheW [Melioribacteraceae bacterium]
MDTEKKKTETDEVLQLVSFKIGNEEFGVDILKVQEINKMMQITKVPNAPSHVEGVINLRGKIIPVIDLRIKLRIERKDYNNNTRIVVLENDNNIVGFIVDEVKEVLRIPKSITEAPPEMVAGIDSKYITSIGKLEDRLLILLDLDEIINNTDVEYEEAELQ